MGEYAIRKSDHQRIKIGTCEDMYYIRFADRDKVRHESGNVDVANHPEDCRFRLPFADEDHLKPGEYDDYDRPQLLYRKDNEWFSDPSVVEKPGVVQLHHEGGLLLNVPCYHGEKLPEVPENWRVFWNGKSAALVLSSLRITKDETGLHVWPVVCCRWCGEAWRYQWETIWDFIPLDMQRQLREYYQPTNAAAVAP